MSFSLSIVLALASVLGASSTPAMTQQQMPQAGSVKEYVQTYFADELVMVEIASCESHFQQFGSNGQVLKNPKSSAVGVFQIMSSVHDPIASDLNLDIYTIQGNLAYAQYLYEKEGTAPWNSSKACWGKTDAALAMNK